MRLPVLSLVAITACASAKRAERPCEPPHPDFLRVGEVYASCAVDKLAEVRMMSRPDMSGYRPVGNTACVFADIDIVIDTAGFPIGSTAKVTRTNDPRYADIARSALLSTTFYPAKKGDRPVMQLFRYGSKAQMMTVVVPAGSLPPSRPTSRPPVC